MAASIEDYGLIGDCETAALMSKDGSIDWLCWPRFDSGSCFAALLGDTSNGRWRVAPADGDVRNMRRYRPNTLILETSFVAAAGTDRPKRARTLDGQQAIRLLHEHERV